MSGGEMSIFGTNVVRTISPIAVVQQDLELSAKATAVFIGGARGEWCFRKMVSFFQFKKSFYSGGVEMVRELFVHAVQIRADSTERHLTGERK